MKKRINDGISVGSDKDEPLKNKKSGKKGSVQSGDSSKVSKKNANIHRQ